MDEGVNNSEVETYDLDFAIRIAKLWRAGKPIGGDPYMVVNTLLAEVERFHAVKDAPAEEAAKRLGYESFNYTERS